MRRKLLLIPVMVIAMLAVAGTKEKGKTVLKDVQPAGTPSKDHKQQYDLIVTSDSGKDYTCRTKPKKDFNAAEFVVGSNVTYEFNGNKGKIKTSEGKDLDCTVVRVANASSSPKP